MSKIILRGSRELTEKAHDLCDGFIVGVEGLSVNVSYLIDDLSQFKNLPNDKLVYVTLNKNMVNDDLEYLKKVMTELSKIKVEGIIFYDIAVFNINKNLGLNLNLVWDQEHFTTNHFTSNYWYDEGVKSIHISSEITLIEIKEIIENSKMNLFLTIFGHLPMFNSFRHLVNNYLNTFNIDAKSDVYYMEDKGKNYPIIDNKYGTTVYSSDVLNTLDEFILLNDYDINFVVDSFLQDSNKMIEVLEMIKSKKINNERIDELFKEVDKGFFYKETIYKVKK